MPDRHPDVITTDGEPDATPRDTAAARADRIRNGIHVYLDTLDDVAKAYAARDWEALGYPSWQEYIDGEFSEQRLRLSAPDRQRAVAELRKGSMSQRAIGAALGVDAATVNRDLRQSGVADATPDVIQGADGKTYPATRPAADAVDGECEHCKSVVPVDELTDPDEPGRCAACRVRPPDDYVITVIPYAALLPGDYVPRPILTPAGPEQVWKRIARVFRRPDTRVPLVDVWTEWNGVDSPRAWGPTRGADELVVRRAPGRGVAGGVTFCARCRCQVPTAVTYNDKCPDCLDERDNAQRLNEKLAAQDPKLTLGPEQTMVAAQVRAGDRVWMGDFWAGGVGWQPVTYAEIEPQPDVPGDWLVQARTRKSAENTATNAWGWMWDQPIQVRRPLPAGEQTPTGEPDAEPHDEQAPDDDQADEAEVPARTPPAPLTPAQIGRLREAYAYARSHGWTHLEPGQMEREYPGGMRIDVTWNPAGRELFFGYSNEKYRLRDDQLGVEDVDQALDVLCVLGFLPVEQSRPYRAGQAEASARVVE